MRKETTKKIKNWIRDYEKSQPKNLSIDEDTFEGSAYYLFLSILNESAID
jgi:hypothetical protein